MAATLPASRQWVPNDADVAALARTCRLVASAAGTTMTRGIDPPRILCPEPRTCV